MWQQFHMIWKSKADEGKYGRGLGNNLIVNCSWEWRSLCCYRAELRWPPDLWDQLAVVGPGCLIGHKEPGLGGHKMDHCFGRKSPWQIWKRRDQRGCLLGFEIIRILIRRGIDCSNLPPPSQSLEWSPSSWLIYMARNRDPLIRVL